MIEMIDSKYAGIGRLRLFSIGRYLPTNNFISIEIEASVWESTDGPAWESWESTDGPEQGGYPIDQLNGKHVLLISHINPSNRYKLGDISTIASTYFDSISCICPFAPTVDMELRLVSMSLEQIFRSMVRFFDNIKKSPNAKAMFSCNKL